MDANNKEFLLMFEREYDPESEDWPMPEDTRNFCGPGETERVNHFEWIHFEYLDLVNETDKAVLIKLKENLTVWFPKSVICWCKKYNTIYFPSWFALKAVKER
jgi:hypothetical protein